MNDKTNPKRVRKGWLAAAAALLLSAAGAARAGTEHFSATLVNPGGRPSTAPIVVHIDRYSSGAEIQKLSAILADKGPEGLRDALWELEVGYIRIGSGLGYPVAVAISQPTDAGRRIRLMMDRPISFRELARGARSLDYPFSYLEIDLGKDGKGEGKMFAAAKISLTAGTIDVENYSFVPLRLLNVRGR
jgi:hypothetical protein